MKKIFTIIFVLILLSPTAAWLVRLDFGIDAERIGLKPPRFDARVLLNNDYYRSFDQYLNDNFSLRDPLVVGKRWLDYRLFGMTDTAAVHVGNRGWLYSRQSIEDVQKEACDDAALIEQLTLSLHAIDRMMTISGRQFVFTVAPNKSSIYPEFLGFIPTGAACQRNRYDLLLEAFEHYPLKSFVRLENRLLDAKQQQTWLYHPTGTYWNDLGARIAAKAIRERIIQEADYDRAFDQPQKKSDTPVDLARHMLGLKPEPEEKAVAQLTSAESSVRHRALVYGDGFLKKLVPYLSQMIDCLEIMGAESVPSRLHGEDWQAADIIVLEKAESELASLRLNVDSIFSSFEPQVRIPIRHPIDLQTFVPQSNISLNHRTEGLEIKTVGSPSRLALNSIPGSDRQVFRIVKLTVMAPHSDIMTIVFESDPARFTRRALKSGISVLYLPLPFQQTLSLSINPGSKAGVLTVQSAEMLGFSNQPQSDDIRLAQNVQAEVQQDPKIALPEPDSEAITTAVQRDSDVSEKKPHARSTVDTYHTEPTISSPETAATKIDSEQKIRNKKSSSEAKEDKSDVTPAEKKLDHATMSATEQNVQILDPESLPVPTTTAPLIKLTDFADGRIFQRRGNSADIVISGTYSGPVEAIEARVVRSDTLVEIVSWTVIDPSPANGIFVGQLTQVPQGGWYAIQIRSQSNPVASDNGKNRWGVGMLIACLGQSNMNEWFHTGNDLRAHSLLRRFSNGRWLKLGTKGNAAIAFGNRIIERLGIPVGLLDFAVNGSGLRKEADWGTGYWVDTAPHSIYDRFVSGVFTVGGVLEYIVWIQGEADAAKGTVTEKEYVDSLTHFIENQIRSDIANGSNRERLPFLVVMMIKRPGGKDLPHQAIRNAQKQVVENVAECYMAATTLDLANHGRQHLKPKAYITMGNRVAQTVLYLVGKEPYHRGPRVVHARQIDDRTVEIKIQHAGGNDFKPTAGISGWEIMTNGVRVPIRKVFRYDAQTIRIVAEHPLAEQASIRYLYGAMPDVNHAVVDNSPLALPLEEYQSEIN